MMKANANQQATFFALLAAFLTLLFGGNAAAADLLSDSPAEGNHADHQRVLIAPYGWGMAVSETVGIIGIVVRSICKALSCCAVPSLAAWVKAIDRMRFMSVCECAGKAVTGGPVMSTVAQGGGPSCPMPAAVLN